MSPLLYLTTVKTKNKLLELLRNPLKLIVVAGFFVLMVMNFFVSQNSPSGERPMYEFYSVVYVFYLLCFTSEAKKGFQSGGAMFSMADVNLLFMSPLKSVTILFHGMLGRLGSSLFMGVAFVYQFALLRSYYPINVSDMLIAVAGYGAVVFISQLTGMLIYFFSCGDDVRLKKAKAIFCLVYAAFITLLLLELFKYSTVSLSGFAAAITAFPLKLFPVAGWVFMAVEGAMKSDLLMLLTGALLNVAFSVASFIVIAFSKHGYYEDVLLSAEKNGDTKADDGSLSNIKVKDSDDSLKKGEGASVLFFKHFLENCRMKSALFSPSSFFYLVLIGVYGFIFNGDFVMLFTFSCMVSFLPVLSGRWIKELTMPHVYLIPEPPMKKLFFIVIEMFPKILVESLLQCGLIAYLCDLEADVFFCIIAVRVSVSFVIIGSSLLVAGIFREREKNNIFLAMSILPGILFTLPSVFAGAGALNFGTGFVFAFILMAAVNTLVFLLLLFFARNLLSTSE